MNTKRLQPLLLIPFLVIGCTEDTVSVDEITETPIAASGGQALSAGGELTLTFQDGSLSQSSVVTIETERNTSFANLVSPVFNLSVQDGTTTFDTPVQWSLTVDSTESNIILVNLDGAAPEVIPSAYDVNTKRLTADLSHFSRYAASTATAPACPTAEPSGSCQDEGLSCNYGEECCCGQCHPSINATCSGGFWAVRNTDACFISGCPDAGSADQGAPDMSLPDATSSDAGGTCPSFFPQGMCQQEGLTCEYGEECCCGECFPALRATCSGGVWAGMNTDACFRPSCPDAG